MRLVEIRDVLEQTHHPDSRVRRKALHDLCPCRVRSNEVGVWDRLLEMRHDREPSVRSLVLHCLTDGSPRVREEEVVEALETIAKDPDRRLRRRARGILAHYRRTGRVNQE